MPIVVPCPQCGSKLSAPDDAAGKRVRCPKFGCGAIAEVPGLLPVEEVPVVDATIAPRRPQQVEVIEDEDEDERPRSKRRRGDEETDFDHPRRKKRRQTSGPSPGLAIAIALGSILLVGGVGLGVYLIVNKEKDGTASDNNGGNGVNIRSGPKAAIPAGWLAFTSPSKSFTAYFPTHPALTNAESNGNSVDMAILGGPRERLAMIVVALKLPQGVAINHNLLAEHMRQGVLKKQGRRMRLVSQRSVTWLGRPALEMTFEQSNNKGGTLLVRQLTTDKYMYFAFFGDATGRPNPDEANGFFDNLEIVR